MATGVIRKRGIRRHGARREALQALAQAGGSMEYDQFHRLLATIYGTKGSLSNAVNNLRHLGFIQRRVQLTASGSALLSKTEP